METDGERVLEALLDGVLVIDDRERVERLNAAACRILGVSAEAARGRPLAGLLGEPHPAVELARRTTRSGRSAAASDLPLPGGPGGAAPDASARIDVSASPLFDDAGRVEGCVVVLSDRSLRQGLAERDRERDRLIAFGRIATGIAHEVKNPLGGIRGAGELVARRAGDPRTREAAELIVHEVDRIARLLDQITVFGRGDAPAFAPVNLHRVLDRVIELVRLDPKLSASEVRREFDPSIPEFQADAARLEQVFLNLARNALEAMQEAPGVLTIVTRVAFDRHLTVEGQSFPSVRVEFRDQGPGIDPSRREQVLLPFVTGRPEGTGLGLSIAQYWVTRHGGLLRIGGSPGEGAVITVELPLRTGQ